MRPAAAYLVAGPADHGVVLHARRLAAANRHLASHLVAVPTSERGTADPVLASTLGTSTAFLHVTDKLFGTCPEEAAAVLTDLGRRTRLGLAMHDLPQPAEGHDWYERRRVAYRRIARAALRVVVSSRYEQGLLGACFEDDRERDLVIARTTVIPLPVERDATTSTAVPVDGPVARPQVAVLGFVHPGKGLDDVIDAAAAVRHEGRPVSVVNYGAVARGHDDLVPALSARAARVGVGFTVTGFLDDEALAAALRGPVVPLAPHRHVSASGSVNSWIEAGRRPIVRRTPYAEELADRMPGTLHLTDDIGRSIVAAIADPSSTRLAHSVAVGPSWAEAADRHLAVMRELGVTGAPVSVVVPYYRRQDQLDRLLAGLDIQTHQGFEVVVADDGSPDPPRLGSRRYAVCTVRQEDHGFRLAAARNLGARAASGSVLVFLDQDCVPAPTYVERVVAAVTTPWSLVVGHRRHVDLAAWSPDDVRGWLCGAHPAPRELEEPRWLLDGYDRTRDLTVDDPRAYQLLIGAVTSLHRDLFEHVGGYDESIVGYGGEDWDFAHRALVAGADTRWLSDAVAWHDGPDLAGRDDDLAEVKNAETLALATRLPDADVRGRHLVWSRPDVVVRVRAGSSSPAAVLASVESLVGGTDAHVWVADAGVGTALLDVLEDPRVHVGEPADSVLSTARYLLECDPVVLSGASLRELCAHAPVAAPGFRLSRTRDLNRSARGVPAPPCRPLPPEATVEPVPDQPFLERLWQRPRMPR